MMKVTVYTAIFGKRDRLWSVYPLAIAGAEYVCFSDRPRRDQGLWTSRGNPAIRPGTKKLVVPQVWDVRVVKSTWGPRRTARHYKTMPQLYMPDADVWIWVDGNVRLTLAPQRAVSRWLKSGDLATFKHPDRGCLYHEGVFCALKNKDSKEVLERQARAYRADGMPRSWGLAENRCVIRRNTPEIRELGELWWAEIREHSVRDQVSFPYVCWQLGLRWRIIPGRIWARNTHKHFYFSKHGA